MILDKTKFVNLNSSPLLKDDGSFAFVFLKGKHGDLKYETLDNSIFRNNLILIESHLPQILSDLILHSFKRKEQSLSGLIEMLAHQNLNSKEFYKYKIKEFLKHLALGLSTKEIYYGEPNIYNHYPVLKNENDILYYGENSNLFLNTLLDSSIITISNRGEFEALDKKYVKLSFEISLLQQNTKIETGP